MPAPWKFLRVRPRRYVLLRGRNDHAAGHDTDRDMKRCRPARIMLVASAPFDRLRAGRDGLRFAIVIDSIPFPVVPLLAKGRTGNFMLAAAE